MSPSPKGHSPGYWFSWDLSCPWRRRAAGFVSRCCPGWRRWVGARGWTSPCSGWRARCARNWVPPPTGGGVQGFASGPPRYREPGESINEEWKRNEYSKIKFISWLLCKEEWKRNKSSKWYLLAEEPTIMWRRVKKKWIFINKIY